MLSDRQIRDFTISVIEDIFTKGQFEVELQFGDANGFRFSPFNEGNDMDIDSCGEICHPFLEVNFVDGDPEFVINFGRKSNVRNPTFEDFMNWINEFSKK